MSDHAMGGRRAAAMVGALAVGFAALVMTGQGAAHAATMSPAETGRTHGYHDNEGGGTAGPETTGTPAERQFGGGTDAHERVDIRSTQGIVRPGTIAKPGNMALPHTEGRVHAGKICTDGGC